MSSVYIKKGGMSALNVVVRMIQKGKARNRTQKEKGGADFPTTVGVSRGEGTFGFPIVPKG